MKTIAQQLKIKKFPFEIKDSNGNKIYFEKADGFWGRYEYDDKGNITYFENSYGYWYKSEYDSKGNQIYYETSGGYWSKSEYDSNGNRIYYENANGAFIDKRPKIEFMCGLLANYSKELSEAKTYREKGDVQLKHAKLILDKIKNCSMPDIVGRSEQLICPCCGSDKTYKTDAIHCNRCAVTTAI